MSGDAAALQAKVTQLETQLAEQAQRHEAELESMRKVISDLQATTASLEEQCKRADVVSGGPNSDVFTRHVEWTINSFSQKAAGLTKGESIWSPKFNAAGMQGLMLEFFPMGREKTTFDGFCSLFLWCPNGTKLKYQLRVGSFFRAPDEDEYTGRIGHGHSNFCPLDPEVDREKDCITLGVNFIEVRTGESTTSHESGTLRLIPSPMESIVRQEAEVLQNRNVSKVNWRITKVAERLKHLPRGASMWTRLFTAAGIREMLLEFYPNGSTNTTKEGFCAFYIRCPEGVSVIVTLLVGSVRKGPIKTTFDSLTGKGLPDFCSLQEQIDTDGSLTVGIELQNQPSKTLTFQS